MILEGKAGTGKTYLLLEALKQLHNCVPLVTAPTGEAVGQLSVRIDREFDLKTTYSALGFRFNTETAIEKLEFKGIPQDVDNYNLLVVDEASFVGEQLDQAIQKSQLRVLFVGHRAQLPEVRTNAGIFYKYESLIFTKNYPIYTLTQPIRNTGEIYQFCNHLESLITAKQRIVKRDYNFSEKQFSRYLLVDAKEDFLSGESKIIGWRNTNIDSFNNIIRKEVFKFPDLDYLPLDRILLTRPVNSFFNLDTLSISKLLKFKTKVQKFRTNSAMVVDKSRITTVAGIKVYKLTGSIAGEIIDLYVPLKTEKVNELKLQLITEAYARKSAIARVRAFKNLHFICSLFANVKYSYAITAYRAQGMTIPRVIVDLTDINKCSNVYLKHKLLYVAASRAGDVLNIKR